MRQTFGRALGPVVAGLFTLALVSVVLGFATAAANAQSTDPILGIDAGVTGNTGTTLGQRDVCIEVHSGDKFNVDVTGHNIKGLSAWEVYMALDKSVVHVVDRDVQFLLASVPQSNTFDTSESVPEDASDDGIYRVGAANITDRPLAVDGSGVLARLTLEAAGPGVTTLSVRPIHLDAGVDGPVLTDINANHIGDTDGDSFFDGAILDAQVAVDQSCPADAQGPIAALAGGDSSGVSAWLIAGGVALGLVAVAGFGGLALIRLRRTGSRGTS